MNENNTPQEEPKKKEEPRRARFIQRFSIRRGCSGCPK